MPLMLGTPIFQKQHACWKLVGQDFAPAHASHLLCDVEQVM